MNNIVFNKNCEKLREAFPGGEVISLADAAAFCGVDARTLEARKDFPLMRMGSHKTVAQTALANWLTDAWRNG